MHAGTHVEKNTDMNLDQTWGLLGQKLSTWGRAFILALPNFLLAILTVIVFWLLARAIRSVVMRLLRIAE